MRRNLRFLIRHYVREGKSYLTIACGCTGGQHRSVAIINKIGSDLKREGYHVSINHRDLSRGPL